MKKVFLRDLEAGMVLADDVKTKHGQIIAEKGNVLKDEQIARFSFYRIEQVYIESDEPEPAAAEASVPEVPQPEAKKAPEKTAPANDTIPYTQRLKATDDYQKFQLDYSRNIATMKNVFQAIIDGHYEMVDFDRITQELDDLCAHKTPLYLFDMLHSMRALDDAVYVHSLNVALTARCIAKWLKMDCKGLDLVSLAGYFCDIGKATIPPEVLNKTGKLTDEELALIREHPLTGRRILKGIPNIDGRILSAALQHHERYDGSGYPRGLQGDEIDSTAAIIAVADVYDAMTTTRSYRAPKCAFQVIAEFEKDGYQKFDTGVLMTFLKHMANGYHNARVILSDGRSGKVIYINQTLSKPIIQFDDNTILDLSRTSGIEITQIL